MTRDPRAIRILTTGGTIDKLYFDALSEFQVGDTIVDRLLQRGRVRHPYAVQEVCRKDSLELTDADRAAIAQAVRDAPEIRIVVTHGTDTMVETAAALADAAAGKTVVFTGALAPARMTESDAPFNLGLAFAAAQTAPPGVWIAMSGTIFDARRVAKDRSAGAFVGRD